VGEWLLEDGASRYVDIDLSDTMLDLARERLARFGGKVELLQGDFLTTPIDGSFDVALTLGYFDYIEDAPAHLKRISELLAPGGSVVASFPRWTWTKGPIRKVRYELINNCPIFDYDEAGLHRMFGEIGLPRLDIRRGKSGFLVRARAAA